MSLEGRNAVVTGGASGIGKSICLRLARDGADIAIWDLDLAGAREVAAEIERGGRRALVREVDVASATSVGAAAAEAGERLGPIHILVNDAGISGYAPVLEMTEEQWDRMIAVHLKGTFNCSRALAGGMVAAGWGRIVNIASVAALTGAPGIAHYSAAKAGIIGFTKSLTQELGPHGVTVNVVAPGVIDTPMLRRSGMPDEILDRSIRANPVKRIGTPEDVAAACAYLVSEEAGFVTGQVLSPNGGGRL